MGVTFEYGKTDAVNVGLGSGNTSVFSKSGLEQTKFQAMIAEQINGRGPLRNFADGAIRENLPAQIGGAVVESVLGPIIAEDLGYSKEDLDKDYTEEIEGTRYEPYYNLFSEVRNDTQFFLLKEKIDIEQRQIAAQTQSMSGLLGTFAGSLSNPTTLIPGVALIKRASEANKLYSALKSGASSAALLGGTIAAEEIGLQALQELRTTKESAFAVGFGTVLGAGLGGIAAKGANKTKFLNSVKEIQDGFLDKITKLENAPKSYAEKINESAGAKTLSAEEKVKILDDMIKGDELANAFGVDKVSGYLKASPVMQVALSPSAFERQFFEELVENPLITKKNQMDIKTPAAIETLIRSGFHHAFYDGFKSIAKEYKKYKKAFKQAKEMGEVHGKPVSQKEFGRATTVAAFNKDNFYAGFEGMEYTDAGFLGEYVSNASKSLRDKTLEKVKEKGIEMGLDGFHKDMSPEFDESYMHRVWNRKRISLDKPRFVDMLTEDFSGFVQQQINRIENNFGENVSRVQRKISEEDLKIQRYKDSIEGSQLKKQDLQEQVRQIKEGEYVEEARYLSEDLNDEEMYELFSALNVYNSIKGVSEPKSLVQEIRRLGGIYVNDLMVGDLRVNDINKSFRGLINKNGKSLDELSEALTSSGYYKDRPEINTLIDDIVEESKGNKIYKDEDYEKIDLLDQKQHAQDIIDMYGFNAEAFSKAVRQGNAEKIKQLRNEILESKKQFSAKKKAYYERLIKKAESRRSNLDKRLSKLEGKKQERLAKIYADEGAESLSRTIAQQVADMLTTNSRITPLEALQEISKERGFLQPRTLPVRSLKYLDFLELDPDIVLSNMLRSSIPDMFLKSKFGDVNMSKQIRMIEDEYDDMIKDAPNLKTKNALSNEKSKSVKRMQAFRDILRGKYSHFSKDPEDVFSRSLQGIRTWNFMTFMGGFVFSSLPDIMRVPMEQGFLRTNRVLFSNAVRALNNLKMTDVAEVRLAGVGLEGELYSRLMEYADLGDFTTPGTAFEKYLRNMSHKYSQVIGADIWNNSMKTLSGLASYDTIMRASITGDVAKSDIDLLANLGIGKSERALIKAQFEKHGYMDGKNIIANSEKWDSDVRDMFRAAMNKQANIDIVTPGISDKLFILQKSEIAKTILQFQSFNLAAHNRVLIRGLQRKNANMYFGMINQVLLGMLVAKIKALQYEQAKQLPEGSHTADWDERRWVQEGIDRSGILALTMMTSNTIKMIAPMIPTFNDLFDNEVTSRYQATRSMYSVMLGPTSSQVGNLLGVTRFMDDPEGAARSARRLIPGNNIFYARPVFDALQESVEENVR